MNEWVSGILTEQINKKVVVYAGRFQPFHKGHYATYQNLVKQFGKDSVYIGTSDKTDNIKSPFNFKEKKEIMMKMFGIPSNKIVQIKNPYAPTEIINKFPEETTAFITVVGEKDRYRLKGKYFEPYHPDKVQNGYKDKGYVYVSPAQSNPISGTDVRNWLSKGSESERMDGFKKAYGKFDKSIFDLVSGKLYKVESTMERFVSHFDISNLLNEASQIPTSGKSLVDDGPGAFYGNFKSYKKVGDGVAERLGWQVIDYLMDDDFVSEFDTEYPSGPGRYPVSFFPTGVAGIGAARYGAIKGKEMRNKPAFAKWAKHIKKVATVVGYSLIDFLDAEDAKTETSKVNESQLGLNEEYKLRPDERLAYVKGVKSIMSTDGTIRPWPESDSDYTPIKKKKPEDKYVKSWPTKPGKLYKYYDRDSDNLGGRYFSDQNVVKDGESSFSYVKAGLVPISPPLINQVTGGITKTTFHATDLNGFEKLLKLQGSKKSLSTFDKVDTSYGSRTLHLGAGGVNTDWNNGQIEKGVTVVLKGTALIQWNADAFTYPDKNGRRWTSPFRFNINWKEFHSAIEKDKEINDLLQKSYDYEYRDSEKPLSSGEMAKLVTSYINLFYKLVKKHKKDVLSHMIDRGSYIAGHDGYNEIVLNEIKVVDAMLLIDDTKVSDMGAYLKQMKSKYPKLKIATSKKEMEQFYRKYGGYVRKGNGYTIESVNESFIMEGGAYGHMNHPFDIEMNLTFGDLKAIIKGALNGNLELAREKTDGQALAISWRDDRGLIAARNKSHLKNKGAEALTIKGVADKFANRGGLTDAYNFAMKDLESAIKGLSKAQRDKIFQQGASFMNLEVIYPTSVNVIPYDQPLLVFHNTTEYNEAGEGIGANQSAARILAGMIKQINKDVQNNYTIQGPPVTELPKSQKLSTQQSKFESMLKKLQGEFKLKDSDGVADYHQAWWEQWVDKNSPETLTNDEKMGLVKRWAFNDKGFRLDNKNIKSSKVLDWAKSIDTQDKEKISKENTMKFEDIFLGVGAEVLSFMSSVLAANPDKAVRDMKNELDTTIKAVQKSGDIKKIEKLRLELERLARLGGKDKIVPNEGIVFVYKGNTYKLTGAFAPLNQILGLMYF